MSLMSITYEVVFMVRVEVEPDEVVCVVGDCTALGNWNPHHAVKLHRESSPRLQRKGPEQKDETVPHRDIWKKKVKLHGTCGMRDFQYRYFVCKIRDSDSEESDRYVKVIRWETNLKPRVFSPADFMQNPTKYDDKEIAMFGDYGGKSLISLGWLTDQSEIHIRFTDNPIHMWKPKYRKQTYSIKCTPLDQRYKDHLDEDEEEEDWGTHNSPPSTFTKVLVSVLNEEHCVPAVQSQFGTIYNKDDYMIFTAQTPEPESLGFQFDFYVREPDMEPKHIGYCYLLPIDLTKCNDVKKVPITGLRHKPIGQVRLEYLIAKPVPGLNMNMKVSYRNYWKFERGSLDVGHRGMGSSYKHKKLEAVRENTVESLQKAGSHGADYVEFDVQLSKDLIPIIYHDFDVALTYRKKKHDELEYFKLPVKDLTLAELQQMKLSHTSDISEKDPEKMRKDDLDPQDLQPFPTLQRCFEGVDSHVGFNVEIKYPMEDMEGKLEDANFMNRNKYIDTILRCVFEHAGNRRIVFSSFDPDTCVLLQLKQNKYPVLFLTNGEQDYYVPYKDYRTKTMMRAVYFAKFSKLLGIDVFTKCLLQNVDLIPAVKKAGLVLFCWGEDNNSSNVINTLRQHGVDGIIYDRIDEFKSTKKSVFKLERDVKHQLLAQLGVVSPLRNGLSNDTDSDISDVNS